MPNELGKTKGHLVRTRGKIITVESSCVLADAIASIDIDQDIWTMTAASIDKREHNKVANEIKKGRVTMILIEMPEQHPRLGRVLEIVGSWTRLAQDCSITIFGAFSRIWKENPVIADLVAAGVLNMAYHRICHFGWKVVSQPEASSACFVTASTQRLDGHSCK